MKAAFLLENGLPTGSSASQLAPQIQPIYNNIQGINAPQLVSSAYAVNMTSVNVAGGGYITNAEVQGNQIGGGSTLFLYQGFANSGTTARAQILLHEGTHLLSGASDNQLAAAAGVPNASSMSRLQASAMYQMKLQGKCK